MEQGERRGRDYRTRETLPSVLIVICIVGALALIWTAVDAARDQRQIRTTAWLGGSLGIHHNDRRISVQEQFAPPSPDDERTAADEAKLVNARCNGEVHSRGDYIEDGRLVKGVLKLEVGGEPVCIAANGIYVMDGMRVEVDSIGGTSLSGGEYLNQVSVSSEPNWMVLVLPGVSGALLGAGLGGIIAMAPHRRRRVPKDLREP